MHHIATIGFFDGVHLGHQYVFRCLQQEAAQRALAPLIITFAQHPREVLQDGYIPALLTSLDERKARLSQYAETIVLDFATIYTYSAAEFMRFLRDTYDVRVLLMGYDHHFGSDRLSSSSDYAALGKEIGIDVLPLTQYMPQTPSSGDGLPQHVSSTEIRSLLENGNLQEANELLGYPYTLAGTVVHGNAIGRRIGFPTANISLSDPHKLVPMSGVYKVEVSLSDTKQQDNEWLPALLNIGTNPTVGNTSQTLEVHIPHFHQDLYGTTLRVRLLARLRDEQRFPDLSALIAQIHRDLSSLE